MNIYFYIKNSTQSKKRTSLAVSKNYFTFLKKKKFLRANLFVLVFLWRNPLKIFLLNGNSPSQHWVENIFWFRLKLSRKSCQNFSLVLSAYLIWIKLTQISSTYVPGLLLYCYTTLPFREKKKNNHCIPTELKKRLSLR